MTYNPIFIKKSEKEWKKLRKRLDNPHLQHDKLSGLFNVYKIKLRSSGFDWLMKLLMRRL